MIVAAVILLIFRKEFFPENPDGANGNPVDNCQHNPDQTMHDSNAGGFHAWKAGLQAERSQEKGSVVFQRLGLESGALFRRSIMRQTRGLIVDVVVQWKENTIASHSRAGGQTVDARQDAAYNLVNLAQTQQMNQDVNNASMTQQPPEEPDELSQTEETESESETEVAAANPLGGGGGDSDGDGEDDEADLGEEGELEQQLDNLAAAEAKAAITGSDPAEKLSGQLTILAGHFQVLMIRMIATYSCNIIIPLHGTERCCDHLRPANNFQITVSPQNTDVFCCRC